MVYKSSSLAAGGGSAGTGGGIVSINSDTTPAQLIVQGVGISISTVAGTTTITNTSAGSAGVSSFNSRTGAVAPIYGDYNFNLISGTAAVSQGGTGQASLTSHAVLLGEGAVTGVGFATTGTAGRLLLDQGGADPAFQSMTGDASLASTGALTFTTVNSNVGTFGSSTLVPTITANAKGLLTAISSATVTAPAALVTGTTLASNVTASSLTTVGALASGSLTTGFTAVNVAQGGTGSASLTAHAVLLGEGVGNVAFATTGTAARLLMDQGNADPAFKAISGDVSAVSTGALTVLAVHGVTYPAAPSTNTVPVVTSSNVVTYEAVPNAALANSAITIGAQTGLAGGGSVALGSAITLSMGTSVANTLAGYNNSGVFADVSIGTNLNLINSILSGSAISQGSGMTITYSTNTIGFSASGVSAGVSSVSNTDGGSLSITPQTGVVTANLNTAFANTWTATQTGAVSGGVTSFVSQGCIEFSIFANGNSGNSTTIKWDNGNIQTVTISAAASLAFTAPTHPGRLTIVATQDGTGHAYSYTTKILWPGGTVPTWSSGITNTDIASFLYDGTNYYGIGNTGFA